MLYRVINRYSDTDKPDKHGRWARIVYANNLQIAWIKMIIIDDKLFYSVKDFFPSVHNDSPCYSAVVEEPIEHVVLGVKDRFNYFISHTKSVQSIGKNS